MPKEDHEATFFTPMSIKIFYNILYCTTDRNIEKESIREFINKKREMFYLEVQFVFTQHLEMLSMFTSIFVPFNTSSFSIFKYALAVKREEIAQLEERASREEKKLAKAEKLLEEDAALFDTFLKENDKNSVEAIRM